MQLRDKEEAILYFGNLFPQYVKTACYQRAAVESARTIFTQEELKMLKADYSVNLLDQRVLKIEPQHYLKEKELQDKFADFRRRTSEHWFEYQKNSRALQYLKTVQKSRGQVDSTEQIKHGGSIATFADVLADPFEPVVWRSYLSALPLLVKNDPEIEMGKIAPELNVLAALTPVYAETPAMESPCAVSLLGAEQIFTASKQSTLEETVSDNFLFYSPSRLLAVCLAYFDGPQDQIRSEHAVLTFLLHEARHILRGDLLTQPGYVPGSPNRNQQFAAFFADHPNVTVLGFPVLSSGGLDSIITDFNINSSLLNDLGTNVLFGGSRALCSTQVVSQNLLTKADIDLLNTAIRQPKFEAEKQQLNSFGFQRIESFLSNNSILLLKQKGLILNLLQKMHQVSYQPHLPPRAQKEDAQKEAHQNALNENSSQEQQQMTTGTSPASLGGGGKVGLSGGDIFEINQRFFDQLTNSSESQSKNKAEHMARQLLGLANEAFREAQVEFPEIDYSKSGGQLKQLQYRLSKTRPLPPLRLKLRKLRKDLAVGNKIEWYRRHYAFPERLDMAHIARKKSYRTEICVYLDVSGSVSTKQVSKVLSVIKATVAQDQSLSVCLFAAELGEKVHFRAGKRYFEHDFAKLKQQLSHFPSSGTDLQPVFQDIFDTAEAVHVIISDFCFDRSDLISYQQRLKQRQVIFMNNYNKEEQKRYSNQMPLIEQIVRQKPQNMKVLTLKDYSI